MTAFPLGWRCLSGKGRVLAYAPLCAVSEAEKHILFSRTAERALWHFVREALGPDWEALDFAEFLQTRSTQTGQNRRQFWLIFCGDVVDVMDE